MDSQSAAAWWANHPTDPAWLSHYAASVDRPDRALVVAALWQLAPWRTLYEIGCHCGPLLEAIQRAYPDAVLGGCDVNPDAVAQARGRWPSVVEGRFPTVTADLPDESVDVVVSCYTLAYVSPQDLAGALIEASRIARRGVVLCEPMAWDPGEVTWRGHPRSFHEWRHPYLAVLHAIPTYAGWTARCEEISSMDNQLSGLIILERPCASA